MTPIKDSYIKEQMRQKNERIAQECEAQIRKKLETDLSRITNDDKPKFSPFFIIGCVLGVMFLCAMHKGFNSFLLGLVIPIVLYFLACLITIMGNKEKDKKKLRLKNTAEEEIQQAYAEADWKTQQEIDKYDSDVRNYAQRILSNSNNIAPIVDDVVKSFQIRVSSANHSSNIQFIEGSFLYNVSKTGIGYYGGYNYLTGPDYDFDKKRYTVLETPAQCEGLAYALYILVMKKLKSIYPTDFNVAKTARNDASVTLHFKYANSGYIDPRKFPD